MDQQEFVEKFASIFDDVDRSTLSIQTEFRGIDEWSSLSALVLLSMTEEEYGVQLNNQDIKNSTTIEDLYNIVEEKRIK